MCVYRKLFFLFIFFKFSIYFVYCKFQKFLYCKGNHIFSAIIIIIVGDDTTTAAVAVVTVAAECIKDKDKPAVGDNVQTCVKTSNDSVCCYVKSQWGCCPPGDRSVKCRLIAQ